MKLKSCTGAVTEAWFLNMRSTHRKKINKFVIDFIGRKIAKKSFYLLNLF